MSTQTPIVAIVGRTNVGKSTLFNRLIEKNKSLVSDIPGTTRDRFEADCLWRGKIIRLVDTGGLDVDDRDEINRETIEQTKGAVKDADLVVFLVDVKTGLQEDDRKLAKMLRETNKPIILVGNKADDARIRALADEKEWHTWEFGSPFPVSATRGVGTGDLLDMIYEKLEAVDKPPVDIHEIAPIRVSVLGRPNVGKSSLLNAILGHQRFIASATEHTTREPNDIMVHVDGQDYVLVDTAGMRKMARVKAGKSALEKAGVRRSLTTIKRSDVVLLVLDVSQRIHSQDKHLAGVLAEEKASVIIVANKWDKIPDKETNTINEYEEYIRANLPQLDYAPIIFTSALTGKRVQDMFELIDVVYQSRFTELDHRETHKFISKTIKKHLPSKGWGAAHPKITSFHQTDINPPTFRLGIKQKEKEVLNESYVRFIENQLREQYNFTGSPIKVYIGTNERKRTITGEEYKNV